MHLETWAAFVVAAGVLCLIPGPTVILVVSQAITHGKKSLIPQLAGVLAGDFTAMSLSLLGLGAILAASATLFLVLKWLGAAYLIYLGIKALCSKTLADISPPKPSKGSNRALFRAAFLVTALNPKGIVFFVAFLPQFIVPSETILPQLAILMATFLIIVAVNISFYIVFASKLREKIQSDTARKWFNRVSGGALITAGAITATMKSA